MKQITSQPTAAPCWWIVTKKESADLWQNGRGLTFLVLLSVLLGITSFLLATNSELKLLPPREMVFMIVQISISVSLFISMLIAADSISGERERATLEGLLLVPAGRRAIVTGKFFAAMSIWPAAFLISAAHIVVLSPNNTILGQGLLWGAFLGSLLVAGFTAFGLLVSLVANSNRTSLFISLFVGVLFMLPTQFPGTAQTGFMGRLVKRINPVESVNQILEKTLVNNRTFEEMASWLASPVILVMLACALLFIVAAPRLDLTGDRVRAWRMKRSPAIGLLLLAGLLTAPVRATHAQTDISQGPLQIAIDADYLEVKTGDSFDFVTTITNRDTASSAPLVVAMNLVNLGDGDPVDPEDWSPERTQSIEPLAPGESEELSWTINAILEGNYLTYMVVIPEPGGAQTTSMPVSSQGIHLTVQQFSPLNPGGVAPIAFGTPIVLGILLGFQVYWRRRAIDTSNAPIRPI